MKRKIITLLVIVVLMISAVPAVWASPAPAAQKATVGLSLPTLSDPFYEGINNGAEAAADELGINLLTESANDDPATELQNVQNMVEDGIDVLLISPVDTQASAQTMVIANEAGIPIVLVGLHPPTDMFDAEIAVTIAANEVQGGQLAARALCSAVENTGTVLAITGDSEGSVAQQRFEGFGAYMADSCADVNVVEFDPSGMDESAFVEAFTEALRAEQDVTGVIAINETLALPAAETAVTAEIEDLAVIGFDASDDALTALNQGLLQGVVLPVGWWMGETALAASNLLVSDEIVNSLVLINHGLLDIETVVRAGPEDPRSGDVQGGGGDLQGGGGDLQGGGGDLQGGGGDLQGGGGDLQGGGGDLQ